MFIHNNYYFWLQITLGLGIRLLGRTIAQPFGYIQKINSYSCHQLPIMLDVSLKLNHSRQKIIKKKQRFFTLNFQPQLSSWRKLPSPNITLNNLNKTIITLYFWQFLSLIGFNIDVFVLFTFNQCQNNTTMILKYLISQNDSKIDFLEFGF